MSTFGDHPRNATIQIATVAGERQSVPCTFDGLQDRCLGLTSRDRIPVSTAIQVQHEDTLFLGEVMACGHNVDDTWHLEVKVEQVLTGLQSLMTLRARLLGEPVPEMSPVFSQKR